MNEKQKTARVFQNKGPDDEVYGHDVISVMPLIQGDDHAVLSIATTPVSFPCGRSA